MNRDDNNVDERESFHWETKISWKSRDKIVCRGYDVNELAQKVEFSDMVFLLLRGDLPSQAEQRMLNYLMISFAEHAFSPSAVSARMVASGRPPLNAAIAAGILTFGEAHGPGHLYSELISTCLRNAKASGSSLSEAARQLVAESLRSGKKVPGLHQPQHIDGDPRAAAILSMAEELGIVGEHTALQREITEEFSRQSGRRLHPNVLGSAGCVLLDLGFSSNAAWAIGILSRAFSCAAHAIEEIETQAPWRASANKTMVDILDLSLQGERYYSGPELRPVPSKSERGFADESD